MDIRAVTSSKSLRNGFTAEQVERARRYHRPLYLALLVDLSFAVGALAVFSFGPVGGWMYRAVEGEPWWEAAPAFTALVVGANLSDLEPPLPVYLLLFSHPTAPERIAAARARPCPTL